MLSKILNNKRLGQNLATLAQNQARCFSHGPYNPMSYKSLKVMEGMPETEDYYEVIKTEHSNPPSPVYNMRHIHPIR
jgi:hypothetical protein